MAFLLIGLFTEVEQGIVGGIGHGNGCFQLMGDVVGEVGLHLIEGALPDDGLDQEIEGQCQQQHDKARRRQDACHFAQEQPRRGLDGEFVTAVVRPVVHKMPRPFAGNISRSRVLIDRVGLDADQAVVTAQAQLLQSRGEQGVIFLIPCTLKAVHAQVQALLNHLGKFGNRHLVLQHLHEGIIVMAHTVAVGLRISAKDNTRRLLILVAVQCDLGRGGGFSHEAAVLPHPGTHVQHAVRTFFFKALKRELSCSSP